MQISSAGFGSSLTSGLTLGSGSSASASSSAASQSDDSVVQDFLDYAKMTPAERMKANILKSLGLTEQQYDALSPAQKQAIDQKITEIMKQQLEQNAGKTGQLVDTSA
jgi:hypothetical protein